jgi:cytochrome c biogenesis protein CcdA
MKRYAEPHADRRRRTMKTVKVILTIAVLVSGIGTGTGVAAFFTENQAAMPTVAAITVSAFGMFLFCGIVWFCIDISECVEQFGGSPDDLAVRDPNCKKYPTPVGSDKSLVRVHR